MFQPFRQHMLAIHPQPQAGEGDPDLCRGYVIILLPGAFQDFQDHAGNAVSLLRPAFNRSPGDPDHGKLRSHKQTVQQNQNQNNQNRNQHYLLSTVPSFSESVIGFARMETITLFFTRSTSTGTPSMTILSLPVGRLPRA